MPPRGAGGRGGPRGGAAGGPPPGGPANRGGPPGRGGGTARGGGPAIRGGRGGAQAVATGLTIGRDVQTIGVVRPGLGRSGRQIKVYTNHFKTSIPEGNIHHYDGM